MDNLSKIHQWLKTIESKCVIPRAGAPKWLSEKDVFEYETVSVEIVVYLKAVRAVQSLTSLRLLCSNGLFIDFFTIGRCIFGCCNEIDFLLAGYPSISTKQERFLKNFRKSTIDVSLDDKIHPNK